MDIAKTNTDLPVYIHRGSTCKNENPFKKVIEDELEMKSAENNRLRKQVPDLEKSV